ncbi:WYL domain-containing protein (plasmid) [Rathayibacter sp. VKM Ac-2803]|uniref:helix-turn-helix transcriptional regulator n=1 Tax=Rathayibacter sp. VKM Ac-2803 TaxID=2609256 RepID=UPI00135BA07E|nr:WYL domain-containing protein [Rathayibacter sp. VKM Ac-2803]MWV51488.1 WYL domain-containing protein [Rathayibacter sp. VKM Ac-2803]
MRADRLVSLVLLLRQRGRLTANELAGELEVSTRTVLRDIEALSTAGVPVYADRGRHGGFSLLPGFRTELTGLNPDETLALLAAGGGTGKDVLGLGPALSSALRKVIDALPDGQQLAAVGSAQRVLLEPEADLLARPRSVERIPEAVMTEVRRAVLNGHRLRIEYAAENRAAAWRTTDPIGLVTVRDKGYLLATVDGNDRTYRLSRIVTAEELDEPAQRSGAVDLEELWRQRGAKFRAGDSQLTSLVLIDPRRREDLATTAVTITRETVEPDGRLRMEVTFQDLRHAEWALWQLGTDAEALTPTPLRATLHRLALELADRYGQGASR